MPDRQSIRDQWREQLALFKALVEHLLQRIKILEARVKDVQSSPRQPPTQHDLLTLHKYFTWSTRFRGAFNEALRQAIANGGPGDPNHPFVSDLGFNMSYWYAAMFVVVEGYEELGCKDDAVDALLASPNIVLLKRYRHGVFHFQKDYLDDRFINFVKVQGTAEWASQLSQALGAFFHREFGWDSQVSPTGPDRAQEEQDA